MLATINGLNLKKGRPFNMENNQLFTVGLAMNVYPDFLSCCHHFVHILAMPPSYLHRCFLVVAFNCSSFVPLQCIVVML